jgi:hypothetical protein
MVVRGRSSPVRIKDVLLAALPELGNHMLQDTVRRDWGDLVGSGMSRHSQPGALKLGALDVTVDNSPWLHELTLRSGELLARLQGRYGLAIKSLRFVLGPVAATSNPLSSHPRRADRESVLGPADAHVVESMISAVNDLEVAASLRRVLTKDTLARQGLENGRAPADRR